MSMGSREIAIDEVEATSSVPACLLALAANARDAMYLIGHDGRLEFCNDALLGLLGAETIDQLREGIFDRRWADLEARHAFRDRLRERGAVERFERVLVALDGAGVGVLESRYALPVDEGRRSGYVGLMSPIEAIAEEPGDARPTGRRRDALTGAYTLESLLRLRPEIESGDEQLGCLAFEIADEVERPRQLQALAHLVTRLTRPEDMLVALGGGRLGLLAHCDSLPAVKAIADRVAALGRRELKASFSVGVSWQLPGERIHLLLERAATSQYLVKPALRARVATERSGPRQAA